MILAILFGMYIYGHEVLEVYNPLKEKANAEREKEREEMLSSIDKDKYFAEFKKFKETQDKSTSCKGDPNLMV